MSDSKSEGILPSRQKGHMKDGHHLIHDSFPSQGEHSHPNAHMGSKGSSTHGPNTHSYSTGGSMSSKGDSHESVYSGGGQI